MLEVRGCKLDPHGCKSRLKYCELVAEVSSQTKDKILIDRSDTSVRGELAVLARNKAAEMGANVIVPSTAPDGGVQGFTAYLC